MFLVLFLCLSFSVCLVLSCFVVFHFIFLDACLFSYKREKIMWCGFERVGRWRESGRSWRRGNHDKNILYKNYYQLKMVVYIGNKGWGIRT